MALGPTNPVLGPNPALGPKVFGPNPAPGPNPAFGPNPALGPGQTAAHVDDCGMDNMPWNILWFGFREMSC